MDFGMKMVVNKAYNQFLHAKKLLPFEAYNSQVRFDWLTLMNNDYFLISDWLRTGKLFKTKRRRGLD